jgi:hypothetical protein
MDHQKQQLLSRAFPETTPFHLSHYGISVLKKAPFYPFPLF